MSEANSKIKLSALLMASLIATNFVCAADAYKNNVVDVRVNKEAGNAVKVTIYTDRPYSEPVVVNKKANNKYVILMPETKSSLKASPTVTNGSGTISNVSVNTQEVSGGKGYTKIIITSEKPINVVPRTQQMTGIKPADLSNTTTTKLSTTAPVSTKNTVAKTQTAADKKLAEQKAKQQANAKAKQLALAKQEQAKKQAELKAKQAKLAQQKAQPVKPATQTKPVQPVQKKEPIEILEQEVKTGQHSALTQETNDPILNKEISENVKTIKQTKKSKQVKQIVEPNDKSVIQNIKAVLKDYQNISLWKLLLLAGAITFPIIVIMIILNLDKKINKKIDKSFRKEEEQVEPYIPVTKNPQQEQSEPTQPVYNSFDEMLNKVDEPLPTFHEEQLHQAEYEKFTQSVNQPIEINTPVIQNTNEIQEEANFNNDYSDDDFQHDFSQETPVIEPEIVNEPEPVVQQENQLTPQTEDAILPYDEAEPPVLPDEPYNPDGSLADFSNVNDKDFFEELTLQTMASNNANGLPEESPADQIFDFMRDDEPQSEDNLYNKAVEEMTDSLNEVQNSYEDNAEIGFDNNPEPQPQDDELTMLTEVKLDDKSGMYLVNYENFSSLVGHIGDDYFVIKKFDELVNSRIILKETEKLKDSTRYLVRVGKNKMVVEITDNSMNRLLDL